MHVISNKMQSFISLEKQSAISSKKQSVISNKMQSFILLEKQSVFSNKMQSSIILERKSVLSSNKLTRRTKKSSLEFPEGIPTIATQYKYVNFLLSTYTSKFYNGFVSRTIFEYIAQKYDLVVISFAVFCLDAKMLFYLDQISTLCLASRLNLCEFLEQCTFNFVFLDV